MAPKVSPIRLIPVLPSTPPPGFESVVNQWVSQASQGENRAAAASRILACAGDKMKNVLDLANFNLRTLPDGIGKLEHIKDFKFEGNPALVVSIVIAERLRGLNSSSGSSKQGANLRQAPRQRRNSIPPSWIVGQSGGAHVPAPDPHAKNEESSVSHTGTDSLQNGPNSSTATPFPTHPSTGTTTPNPAFAALQNELTTWAAKTAPTENREEAAKRISAFIDDIQNNKPATLDLSGLRLGDLPASISALVIENPQDNINVHKATRLLIELTSWEQQGTPTENRKTAARIIRNCLNDPNITTLDFNKRGSGTVVSLRDLPKHIGALTQLTTINLWNHRLTALPESITQLNNLKELNVGNNALHHLPINIGELAKLEVLRLNGNTNLRVVPDSVKNLSNLTSLELNYNQIATLPDLSGLDKLTELDLRGNFKLRYLSANNPLLPKVPDDCFVLSDNARIAQNPRAEDSRAWGLSIEQKQTYYRTVDPTGRPLRKDTVNVPAFSEPLISRPEPRISVPASPPIQPPQQTTQNTPGNIAPSPIQQPRRAAAQRQAPIPPSSRYEQQYRSDMPPPAQRTTHARTPRAPLHFMYKRTASAFKKTSNWMSGRFKQNATNNQPEKAWKEEVASYYKKGWSGRSLDKKLGWIDKASFDQSKADYLFIQFPLPEDLQYPQDDFNALLGMTKVREGIKNCFVTVLALHELEMENGVIVQRDNNPLPDESNWGSLHSFEYARILKSMRLFGHQAESDALLSFLKAKPYTFEALKMLHEAAGQHYVIAAPIHTSLDQQKDTMGHVSFFNSPEFADMMQLDKVEFDKHKETFIQRLFPIESQTNDLSGLKANPNALDAMKHGFIKVLDLHGVANGEFEEIDPREEPKLQYLANDFLRILQSLSEVGHKAEARALLNYLDKSFDMNQDYLKLLQDAVPEDEAEQVAQAQAEQVAQAQAEQVAQAQAEQVAQAQAEQVAQAQAEQVARAQAEQVAQAQAEQVARAQAEQAARAQAEQVARAQAEQVAQAQAEQVAQAQAEQVARAQAEQVARAQAEQVAQAQAEQVARAQAEQVARAQAEQVARAQAEQVARAQAEQVARAQAEQVARAQAEQVARAQAEQVARAQAEQAARAQAEQAARTPSQQQMLNASLARAEHAYRIISKHISSARNNEVENPSTESNSSQVGSSRQQESNTRPRTEEEILQEYFLKQLLNQGEIIKFLEDNKIDKIQNGTGGVNPDTGKSENNCLIISLLQHATGNYSNEVHNEEGRELRQWLIRQRKDVERGKSLYREGEAYKALVREINERHNVNLHPVFMEADLYGQPTLSEASDTATNVVIQQDGGHFEAVVARDQRQQDMDVDMSEATPVATTLHGEQLNAQAISDDFAEYGFASREDYQAMLDSLSAHDAQSATSGLTPEEIAQARNLQAAFDIRNSSE